MLDIFWLRDEGLEPGNLPALDVLAQEIIEDLEPNHSAKSRRTWVRMKWNLIRNVIAQNAGKWEINSFGFAITLK